MALNNNNENQARNSFFDNLIMKLLYFSKEFSPRRVALQITVAYMLLGSLWILLSDKIIEGIIDDTKTLIIISTIKGWIYVITTGLVIFGLIFTALRRIKEGEQKIISGYQELEATHEELTASEEELRQQFETLIESQKQLMESEERYRLISEAANDGIWEEREDIRYFSDRWFEITGYTKEELEEVGDWQKLIHPDDYHAAKGIMIEHQQRKTPYYRCEYRFKKKNGEYIWIQARGKAQFDKSGKVYRMAGSHTDVTDLKEYENRLHVMAYHDMLTGLPNREALYEEMNSIFSDSFESKGAVLFIDLDNFKHINDSMGHSSGDQLIKEIGQRLVHVLKDKGKVYRLSGDEFVVHIYDAKNNKDVSSYATSVCNKFKIPFEVGNSVIHIASSIGVALYPEHGYSADDLLKCADIAMYKAKESGKNRFVIFDHSMNEDFLERIMIERNLWTALDNNEFQIYYQPQLDLGTGKISGFEALLRWNSLKMGFVSPIKFIKVAEDTHLIINIGKWVLINACIFIKRLHQRGYEGLTVSVNVSMIQLLQDDFVEDVANVINLMNIDPRCLELEITESILMESFEMIGNKLVKLQELGVSIALDDFGKGYSSLHYLLQLPISTLKVDKTFIDSISLKSKESALTGEIVSIGKKMDFCVVAEGVETQEQLDYLIEHKCHKIQGYLFSKPMPESEAEILLEKEALKGSL